MIVISAGMQRSGTRWYYNLTHDLAIAAGLSNAREVRSAYQLEDILRPPNSFLHRLHSRPLERLDAVGRQGVSFMVKTHGRATRPLRNLIAAGRFRAVYICRDLRDVIVSGLDLGKDLRDSGNARRYFRIGPYRDFARLKTVEGGTLWAKYQLIPRWESWMRCNGTLITRYEDLCADPHRELRRFADHLELDVTNVQIDQVIASYQPERGGNKPSSHVKGIVGRYTQVMTPRQQELCMRRLGHYLKTMGYLEESFNIESDAA